MIDPHFHFTDRFNLFVRNEGKLKSYGSCNDVRAWSHTKEKQDAFLKDWIREDMKFSTISPCALNKILRRISYGHRKSTQSCHPECKSKILLESIRKSSHELRLRLQSYRSFEKYFEDEELETSLWPCDRTLETLKNIKLFCKLILGKVFGIDIEKITLRFNNCYCTRTNSIKEIANVWQREIVYMAKLVRPETQIYASKEYIIEAGSYINDFKFNSKYLIKSSVDKSTSPLFDTNEVLTIKSVNNKVNEHLSEEVKIFFCKRSKSDSSMSTKKYVTFYEEHKNKRSRSTIVRTTRDVGCDPFISGNDANSVIQNENECLKQEIANLKQENMHLKTDLRNKWTHCDWGKVLSCRSRSLNKTSLRLARVYEDRFDRSPIPREIDVMLNNTLKKAKNPKYQHVSLLEVIHKNNAASKIDMLNKQLHTRNGNPVNFLAKVKQALSDMVDREMDTYRQQN